jgi:hypothetical protein
VGAGQTLVHQYLATVGDTYWVQMESSATTLSGTSVTINDTAPTNDRYNLSIAEVLAAPGGGTSGSISGSITPAASGNGATVTLSQSGTVIATTTAGTNGSYSFASVLNGTYTVTPSATGFTFSPASQSATVNGNTVAVPAFTAAGTSGTIAGSITPAANGSGATVTLSQGGTTVATATAGTNGNYSFASVLNGTYTVTPSATGFTFTPASQSVTVNGVPANVPAFTAAGTSGTINGSIAPAPNGTTASVQLLQGATQIATATVSGTGTYTFPGVLNGSYTVIPSETGFTFAPTSQSVTVNGVPVTVPVFNASAQTWNVSGTITPQGSGSGTTVTLSGTANATTTADVNANYTFTAVVNGAYTVTPTKNGFAFTPASQNVNVNNGDLSAVNFTAQAMAPPPAAIKIDANVSKDQVPGSATVTTPGFSTTFANEMLLAFVGSDYQPSQSAANVFVTSVSGGGLTWQLVKRTNTQGGTAEIWRALAPSALSNVTVSATLSQSVQSSLTVMSFTGIDASGANGAGAIGATGGTNASSGAPTATLVTTRNNSLVLGVGNDYDHALGRTLGPGQSLVHQDLAPIDDTYWVQMQNSPTPVSGTSVTINDVAPTADRYNLSIVEVLPTLNQTSVPDLTIGKSHSGNFVRGQAGAIYTITASNSGGVATSGAVSVTDTLPAGLTASGIGGTNWVCTLSTLTCSRSDALAANASYPPITLVVNVSSNAPASVTNTATVSGGGEVNTSNDTASDVTSIGGTGATGIKLIQSNVNGNENATSNMSVSFTSNNAQGDFLIVTGTAARPASTISISDILGNSYTPAMGPVTDTTQNVTMYIWYVANCKAGANTVTITPSTTAALEIHVSEWSGLASVSPVDQTASATGTGTNVSSGLQTTSLNGELLFGYGWVFNTASGGAGFTPISLVNGDLDEYEIQAAAGSVAATFTQASGTWFAAMATFKPAGATGPVVTVTSPAANAVVTGDTTVTANASDASFAIAGVQFLLDGANLGAQVTAPPFSLIWDTSTATAGSHTVSATAFDSGGQKATAAPISVTVDNSGSAAVVGSWSSPVGIPTVAVNLILLKDNTLLFYEDGASPTVWDYTNSIFTNISTAADLFCSGHAALSDGRILAVGGYGNGSGSIGIANAEIFDPANNTWTAVPNMAYKRWYPTATTLSDGRILVTAGWQTTNHSNAGIPEIYDPVANTWTQLTNANNPFETYPFLFMLGDGRVIHVGGSEFATNTDILDIGAQSWTVVDPRIVDGGSATMYLPGKIMKSGSATDSQGSGPSSNTTFVLDTTQPAPAWVQTPSMAYVRSFLNLTELPDGTVLASGGETDKNGGNIANAVYAAELWSPLTQTWTTVASMHTPREYHSTALLLPDGRVLQSGMGADFGNVPDEMSAEFYSPPYLFKGARPTITQSPAQAKYGANFFVATPDAASIQSAVLIRTGAVTHFFDQNTRYVPLTFQQATGGLTLTAPANAFLAPPGYYMLFLVNGNGVPSIAPFVQLTQ